LSRAWRAGSTRAWRRTRRLVLDRDGHRCQLRLDDICRGRATCVHHVLGRAYTGDDPAYLVASCSPCNLALGDSSAADPTPRPTTHWS
jgi:5-methylcytosine-specific restriction endonuclease McrA